MRKFVGRPDPNREPTVAQPIAPAPEASREVAEASVRDQEEAAADRMAALVMRRAYGSDQVATSARSRAPSDVGRIRRAVSPDIESEAHEVETEVESRVQLSLVDNGRVPVLDEADQESESESEELDVVAILDPGALKLRAMYDRLHDAGIEESEIRDILDLYAKHLAKGGSDEDFMEWIRSHYLAKARPRSRGMKVKKAEKAPPKPGEKPEAGARAKAAGTSVAKSAGKPAAAPAAKAAAKKSQPTGKISARTDKK